MPDPKGYNLLVWNTGIRRSAQLPGGQGRGGRSREDQNAADVGLITADFRMTNKKGANLKYARLTLGERIGVSSRKSQGGEVREVAGVEGGQ